LSTFLRSDNMPPELARAIVDAGFELTPQMKDGGIRWEISKAECVDCRAKISRCEHESRMGRCRQCNADKLGLPIKREYEFVPPQEP